MDRRRLVEPWLETLASHVAGGVVVVDERGRVCYFDPTAAQLLDTPTEEGLEIAIGAILSRMGEGSTVEVAGEDGRSSLLVERHLAPSAGKECLLVLREARELRALDLERVLASRMRSLEDLYRAMAHDLKSPLHAVVLNLDLLREIVRKAELDEETEGRIETYVDLIQGEVARLGRLTQALLSQVSTRGEGQRRVDLRRIQREVATLLEPLARRKSMQVASRVPPRSVVALGNRDRIKQAVVNLAVNAIEASHRGGMLEFELIRDPENGTATFEIRDDGPGISEKIADRVFDAHVTTKKSGTGIGLFVARAVAQSHGGSLRLERRRPRGTSALLSLPLADTEN